MYTFVNRPVSLKYWLVMVKDFILKDKNQFNLEPNVLFLALSVVWCQLGQWNLTHL